MPTRPPAPPTSPGINRRQFLSAGVVGAAALAATAGAPTARAAAVPAPARVPLTRLRRRVVVIGSGFGGGVAALRLTRAGVPVTILERGRRWPTGPNADTFPTVRNLDRRALFYGSAPMVLGRPVGLDPYAGLLDTVAGEGMLVVCGAGYGGGSLTYQGMTLQPSTEVFDHEFPTGLDARAMARVYYPRVAAMLRIATAPDALIDSANYAASRAFAARAVAAGFDVEKIPMPIDWTFALRELRGQMRPSYTNGDCALGVNNGGKHSVDVTYLAAAERTGRLEVGLLHRVTDVVRTGAGEWEVHVVRTDDTGATLENKVITTPALIMGAGSMGTTRLLVRAAAVGGVTDLPDALGTNWGTNADRIYLWSSPEFGTPQGGPVVLGSKDWDEPARANTVIQASIPALALGPFPVDPRSTVLVGYGVSGARGRFVYDAWRDDAILHWEHEADAVIQRERIGPRVRAIAGSDLLLDTNAAVASTWHPMGGAGMGAVCDLEGRVLGQRGLYVLDGALLPGTCAACNPSMTIAALAERAMEAIVRHDVGTVF